MCITCVYAAVLRKILAAFHGSGSSITVHTFVYRARYAMASIDEAQLKVFGDLLYKQITDETDVKISALTQSFTDKLNNMEIDYDAKILNVWSDDKNGLTNLKTMTKEEVKKLDDAVVDINQTISSIEVRLKESMGSKVFMEKSTQFADIVDKALTSQKINTDTTKEDAKVEFLKYQDILKDIENRAGE